MNSKSVSKEYEILLLLIREPLHGREIAKRLKIPLATIQQYLRKLKQKNVVDDVEVGRNKIFNVRKNLAARTHILNAENYKLFKITEKYPELVPILSQIVRETNCDMIILFGSYAKFSKTDESDIDLYLETNSKEIKEKIAMVNSKLQIKIGDFNIESLLIKEIIKNHVIVRGAEKYYEKIKFFS